MTFILGMMGLKMTYFLEYSSLYHIAVGDIILYNFCYCGGRNKFQTFSILKKIWLYERG